jgi:hypothetical protein
MSARYEVAITIDSPWDAGRMLDVRSPWCVKRLCAELAAAHQLSPRADAECGGERTRLVAIRPRSSARGVDVVYRVCGESFPRSAPSGSDGKDLAAAAAVALRAFRVDFERMSPPLTAERLLIEARPLPPPGGTERGPR